MPSTAITALTPGRHIYGAGVWFRNYDKAQTFAQNVAAKRLISATKGGNEITIMREYVNLGEGLDGARGKVKGMTKVIKDTAMMKATFAESSVELLLDALPGCSYTTASGRATIVPGDPANADYLTNITWIGDHASGDGVVGVIIKNPMSLEPLVLKPENEKELGIEIAMEAHYDPAAMATAPYELFHPADPT